mmetsp:Transcript_22423/g.44008  ORF Transcript_22423/g.44008 Transcript_22423/m.44008 type:complete len:399 (+) Transcript_22423:107-1303(+)
MRCLKRRPQYLGCVFLLLLFATLTGTKGLATTSSCSLTKLGDNVNQPAEQNEEETGKEPPDRVCTGNNPHVHIRNDENVLPANGALLIELDRWFRSIDSHSGIDMGAVELSVQECCGRGIRTKRALSAGDRFARIPLQAMVNIEHAVAKFGEDGYTSAELDTLTDLELMAALVLREQGFLPKDTSFWAPLWHSFPINVSSSALFMCEKQLNAVSMSVPQFTAEIRSLRNHLRSRWQNSSLLKRLAPQFPLMLTAILLVQSRSFGVRIKRQQDGQWHSASCLVPFADMLNTASKNLLNADCATDRESRFFECFATTDVSAESFLLAPYHGLSSRSSWINYGFVLDPEASESSDPVKRQASHSGDSKSDQGSHSQARNSRAAMNLLYNAYESSLSVLCDD